MAPPGQKRQLSAADFLNSSKLSPLRVSIASRAKVPLTRVTVGIPIPTVSTMNITISPPARRLEKDTKRQIGVASNAEITTAEAAQKLLQPIDAFENTGLSTSLAENGIGAIFFFVSCLLGDFPLLP